MQIGILEPKDFSKKAVEMLSSIGEVSLFDGKDLDVFMAKKEVLFIRLAHLIGNDFLEKAKNLKYICTPTTGLNHIDLEECKKRQIEIVSLKGEYEFLSTIRATPEHTFGLVLSLLRNYKEAFLSVNNTEWNREKYKGFELYENNIGIIGFGRVGKILAKYFEAFGAKVYFYDIDDSIQEIHGAIKLSNIEEVVNQSNIVILSASYTESNHQFFDKKYIDLLENKYFINTARGELIDEEYLITKLKESFFKGVAMDVIQNEQSNNNLDKLLKLTKSNNLIVTPHIAGATYSSMYRTEEFIVDKLKEDIL
uniref:NAD(P)-dependent oxidoreductase n=1 Tax=Aliarcobacter sp. TaxID=2321116 RepID=UPI00404746E8